METNWPGKAVQVQEGTTTTSTCVATTIRKNSGGMNNLGLETGSGHLLLLLLLFIVRFMEAGPTD